MGLFDSLGRIVQSNTTLETLVDPSKEVDTLDDLLRADDRDMAMQSIRWASANPGRRVDIESETADQNGERRFLALSLVGVEAAPADDMTPMVLGQVRDITEQREAEKNISRRLEVEGAIRSISTFLVETPVDNAATAIQRSLGVLGAHLSANAVVMSTTHADTPDLESCLSWRRPGHGSWIDTPFEASPQMDWFMASLRDGRPVVFDDSSSVVDEEMRHDLARRGIEAFMGVPVPLPGGSTAAIFTSLKPTCSVATRL